MDEITNKIGDWVQVDAETHVMPLEVEIGEPEAEDGEDVPATLYGARCIMQVETESGAVALVETFIPTMLLLQWIEEEDQDD